jgi:hypothetical protein
MINYRELLKKYIKHVLDEESVTYLGNSYTPLQKHFTKEEWDVMLELNEEVWQENFTPSPLPQNQRED